MSTHQSLFSCAGAVPDDVSTTPPTRLTAKETQILMWCFKGKTSWEIARIQNCSEATVNFHFSNIRRKFAVRSRSAALLKAIESGVITFDEPAVRGAHESD